MKPNIVLTPAQIENWRDVLLAQIGPYALLLPVTEIQAYANAIQDKLLANTQDSDPQNPNQP